MRGGVAFYRFVGDIVGGIWEDEMGSDIIILLQLARELPWWHIVTVLTKVKKVDEREYYLRAAVLPSSLASIRCHRLEDCSIQTGVCREDEFLSHCCG